MPRSSRFVRSWGALDDDNKLLKLADEVEGIYQLASTRFEA